MGKKHKSVLAMVWDLSDSLLFKLRFTFIIMMKKIKPIIINLLTIAGILLLMLIMVSGCATLSEKDHERFEDEFNRYKEDKEISNVRYNF